MRAARVLPQLQCPFGENSRRRHRRRGINHSHLPRATYPQTIQPEDASKSNVIVLHAHRRNIQRVSFGAVEGDFEPAAARDRRRVLCSIEDRRSIDPACAASWAIPLLMWFAALVGLWCAL